MNIEQLQCITAIVKCGTFLEAADELHRSQSSVSKSVSRLEEELGVLIFYRSTRRVSLTAVGEEIFSYAERMLSCYEEMQYSVKQHNITENSQLRIGSIYFGMNNRLAPYVADFLKAFPSIHVTIDESTTTPLLRQLEKKELDVVFVSSMYLQNGNKENFSKNPHYTSLTFSVDPYYVIVSKSHPLANRTILTYEQLKGERFIATDKTMDVYHTAIKKVFDEHGIDLNISMQCTNVRSVLHMVSQNVGIAILTKLVVEDSRDLVFIPLKNPLVRDTQMVILNQRNTPSHIKVFFHYIKTQVLSGESLPASLS